MSEEHRYSLLKTDAFVMSCWMNRMSCLRLPVSCFLPGLLVIIAVAVCWVVSAALWPHNHIVSRSPPKETPKTTQVLCSRYKLLQACSLKYLDKSWEVRRLWECRQQRTLIRQTETFGSRTEFGLLCLNTGRSRSCLSIRCFMLKWELTN